MIVSLSGKLVETREQSLVVESNGISYEILVPSSVISRINETKDKEGNVHLKTYYYIQINQASGLPMLIGFINDIERDFFMQFIKVSGIGPKAAVKALNRPIAEITQAIDRGDAGYLKTLPGIGMQRAKEVVAKLQGKVGKFCLIKDAGIKSIVAEVKDDWQEEALTVLLQLQYKKQEAVEMIQKALDRTNKINTAEELLNEIYKQKSIS